MKFYRVHEPELHNLSIAHGLMVIFFSAGSGFLGFALDITKDVVMATGELSAEGRVMAGVVRPACFYIALGFYAAGVWAYFLRRGAIGRIKRESGDTDTFVSRCIKVWQQVRVGPQANAPSGSSITIRRSKENAAANPPG
jgi:hypothetical protein